MKKKTFAALGVTACLSFGAVIAFSGCGDSEKTVSVGDVVDIDYKFSETFLDLINGMSIDIPFFNESSAVVASTGDSNADAKQEIKEEKKEEQKEQKKGDSKENSKSSSSSSLISGKDELLPVSGSDTHMNSNISLGTEKPVGDAGQYVAQETVDIISSVAVGINVLAPSGQNNNNTAASPSGQSDAGKADDEKPDISDKEVRNEEIIVPDDKVVVVETEDPEDEEVIVEPGDTEDEEVVVEPKIPEDEEDSIDPELDSDEWIMYIDPKDYNPRDYGPVSSITTFYREVYNSSIQFSYSDDDGNCVCDVFIYGLEDVYIDGELYSSEKLHGKDVGTIEIKNYITGEIEEFKPGELEDFNEYVLNLFEFDVFQERYVIPPFEGNVSYVDTSEVVDCYDIYGKRLCTITKHGAIEIDDSTSYDSGELVTLIPTDKTGTIEIHNLLTDETTVFDSGEIKDYFDLVYEIFDIDYFSITVVSDASYADPTDDDGDNYNYEEPGDDESYYEATGVDEDYYEESDDEADYDDESDDEADDGDESDNEADDDEESDDEADAYDESDDEADEDEESDDEADDDDESDDEADAYEESEDEADDYDESDDEDDDDDEYTRANYVERKSNSDEGDDRELKFHLCEVCGDPDCVYSYYY